MIRRRVLLVVSGLALLDQGAAAQRRPPPAAAGPSLSAARTAMAGSMLTVFVSRAPAAARLAIALPNAGASAAIVSMTLGTVSAVALTVPGEPGTYELRLLISRDSATEIALRHPLAATQPSATLAAPGSARPGQEIRARAIGPNGERDRFALVRPGDPPEAAGPGFYPAENVEGSFEVPEASGTYELRYVMDAPLTGPRILARRSITVE